MPEALRPHIATHALQRVRRPSGARSAPLASPSLRRVRALTPIQRPTTAPTLQGGSSSSSVRSIASEFPRANFVVPQVIYRPPVPHLTKSADAEPIVFYVRGAAGCGINCADALDRKFDDLVGSEDTVECSQRMQLHIMVSFTTLEWLYTALISVQFSGPTTNRGRPFVQ